MYSLILHYGIILVCALFLASLCMLLKGGRPSTFATDLHAYNSFAFFLILILSVFLEIPLFTPPGLELVLTVGAGTAGLIVSLVHRRRLGEPQAKQETA